MRAAVYSRYGGPEVLEIRVIDPPQPADDQILVRVRAAAVNPVDWKIRRGSHRPFLAATFPMIPGSDLAGEVLEVGASVGRFLPGDIVYARLPPAAGGACAELAVLAEDDAAPMPENLSFEQAAAVPLAALTALQSLRDLGRIAPGMRVLIHGASGGVGTFAVQIARLLGARVTGVASGRNLDLLRELGAHEALDYAEEDFTRRKQVWDLVLDAVSNRSFRQVVRVLSREGRHVRLMPSFGFFTAVVATRIAGIFGYGKRALTMQVQSRAEELIELKEWVEAGEIRPVLHASFPLEEIVRAHAESEGGHARGKIVVLLGD